MIRIEECDGEECVVEQQPGEFAAMMRASYELSVKPAVKRWLSELGRTASPNSIEVVDVDIEDDNVRDIALLVRLRSGAVGRFRFGLIPERIH